MKAMDLRFGLSSRPAIAGVWTFLFLFGIVVVRIVHMIYLESPDARILMQKPAGLAITVIAIVVCLYAAFRSSRNPSLAWLEQVGLAKFADVVGAMERIAALELAICLTVATILLHWRG